MKTIVLIDVKDTVYCVVQNAMCNLLWSLTSQVCTTSQLQISSLYSIAPPIETPRDPLTLDWVGKLIYTEKASETFKNFDFVLPPPPRVNPQCYPPVLPPSVTPQCQPPVLPPSVTPQCYPQCYPPSVTPQCYPPVLPPSVTPQS